MNEVPLAVVGVGHLGRHHARVAASLSGVRVVGVHDHHPGRAQEVADEFSLPVLPDLESVASEAEAVVVATPTVTHAEIAGFFLDRGLHVLVEKPMASAVAEADELLSRAAAGASCCRSDTSSGTTRRFRRRSTFRSLRGSLRSTAWECSVAAASTSTSSWT